MRRIVLAAALLALAALVASAATRGADDVAVRSLDGSGNNRDHPTWGATNTQYLRVAPTFYGDGYSSQTTGPPARRISNRVFDDIGQNIFSENRVSQWGWLWGQFLDHTFGLRDERPAERSPIPFDSSDPLERFHDDLGEIPFARTPAASGTGVAGAPRQQINTVSSYIDAFAVYGGTQQRLDWLRDGSALFLPHEFLPRERDKANPPSMDLMGPLNGNAPEAAVAGDVRANENIGLTAVHTLFAREHNRIVSLLPDTLSAEDKFQIARRVVGAEEQYVTYNEFLPAMGVPLAPYHGYDASVDASLSNEFATVGYRAHSQIHGEMEPSAPRGHWSDAQLDAFRHQGILVEDEGPSTMLAIPLGVTFGNPSLLEQVGAGPLLKGIAAERQYRNDEQIDDSLRSILFQIPKPGVTDPTVCGEPAVNPSCFRDVLDLGAIDVQRGRDHGMPRYNALRAAYGLSRKATFKEITGEDTEAFPSGIGVDDPASLEFTSLLDENGNPVTPGTDAAADEVVTATRRSTLAARLKALYPTVDDVDAFVGMVAEPHLAHSELGELQQAMWKKQFEALRDGDRFFYANDGQLEAIRNTYAIDYRQTLADLIRLNTGADVQDDVFHAPHESGEAEPVAGLVAAYGFDEGTGTAVGDSSGRGNDGDASNTTWTAGRFGTALAFNGSSSFVRVPGSGSLDLTFGITLEAWVKPSALGAKWRTVLFKVSPTGMVYSLYANDAAGKPVTQVSIGGERNTEGAAALPLDTWTHLAATYDGADLALYVNGGLVATQRYGGSAEVSTRPLRIGGNPIWGEWFKGAIDEVRVYNRALDGDEIREDMGRAVASVPEPEGLPAKVLGDERVEPDVNPEPTGTAEAYAATAPADGTIRSLVAFVDGASTAPVLHVAVYSDAAGHPGLLLSEAELEAPQTGWNAVAIPAVAVRAGTRYWIAVLAPQGQLVFRDRCCTVAGSGATEQSAQTSLRSFPRTWTPGARWDDAPLSVYATD